MALRSLIAVLCLAAIVGGCRDTGTAVVRYRLIATIEVDSHPVEYSTTMKIEYENKRAPGEWLIINILSGINPNITYTKTYGEALIIDLGHRGTMYLLPYQYKSSGVLSSFHAGAVLQTLGVVNGLHAINDADCDRIHNIKGRFPFQMARPGTSELRPAMVTFGNELDPQSVRQVDPFDLETSFGNGVKWQSLEIEITNAAVTSSLPKRLPWLKDRDRNRTADSSLLMYPLQSGVGLVRTIQSGHFFHHNSHRPDCEKSSGGC
jgi:hypothetical protein